MGLSSVSFWVPGGRAAATVARHSARSAGADFPAVEDDRVALLVSELVTNAVQHGGADERTGVRVRVSSSTERLRVEVEDPGRNGDAPVERVTPEGGWGLLLVDGLADRWGLDRQPAGGSVAWFELSLEQRRN
ncbi:MAG TPA: ATP-binding protein [Thermoleophilaceae bacterium]|nr:ATP-binding protein [Thermoleophilaceae bacterium]